MSGVFMPNPNDPRVIRTRRLLIDAFGKLLHHKDFNQITVLDVAREATVNRATFYAHFQDKYALLQSYLQFAFDAYVPERIDPRGGLTEDAVRRMIVSLCDYHRDCARCVKRYDSIALLMEEDIRAQLEKFVLRMLLPGEGEPSALDAADESLRTEATMIGWSIYGLTYRWHREGQRERPEELAARASGFVPSRAPRAGASAD
ncbi:MULTISPECIES: TetR/AcrR family transcriptional regulator [Saccharibacillus]|uniref:TetR/AcrR family transcriptional regulator n=1 Tax=Saccharibacillus TaxID=456492 RepID=UPI00123B30D8|nr:TetR/AcrR family transcriptional regulator [Saccharibacillus sp. WB 17]MWJ30901.1 TetR family transcriptional regulator [Saccharibacillus sp. WB 17]